MSTNFIDVEEITTNFDEIMENKLEPICVTCKNKLVSIIGKEHLVKCNNCSKYLLTKPDEFNTNVVIQIGT
jgi:DNA-directed RNA polymerase subunit RPC12/RpoP